VSHAQKSHRCHAALAHSDSLLACLKSKTNLNLVFANRAAKGELAQDRRFGCRRLVSAGVRNTSAPGSILISMALDRSSVRLFLPFGQGLSSM
jgi:hypothetical protein